MARCKIISDLEVHHRNRSAGNGLGNAEVLCQRCHVDTDTFGKLGISPPLFTETTRTQALDRAGNQCECTRTGGCH